MPCDTIQINSVDLEKVSNNERLLRALEAEFGGYVQYGRGENYQITVNGRRVDIVGGQLQSTQLSEDQLMQVAAQIKRGYSKLVVRDASVRFRWKLKQTGDTTYTVER